MKRRYQRRALAACGNVRTAKIRHGYDARAGSDGGRVTDLQRKRRRCVRSMPQRLAVAADGDDIVGVHAAGLDNFDRGVAKLLADAAIE